MGQRLGGMSAERTLLKELTNNMVQEEGKRTKEKEAARKIAQGKIWESAEFKN